MPFSFQGELVYSRAYNKKRKASKDFVQVYKVASNIIDQNNETMMEVILGNFGGFFNSESGLLIATKRKLVFVGDKHQNYKQKTWSYDKLSKPSIVSHALSDTVSFEVNGEIMNFKNVSEGNAHTMVAYLKKQVESNRNKDTSLNSHNVDSTDDIIEEIRKYKALLDEGILTEEEFTAKKKQLLGV